MDTDLLLRAVAALAVMGVLVGIMLAVAARRFKVEADPKVERIFGILPGANCGACGAPSCFAMAERMVAGEAEPTACTAGGSEVANACAMVLGADECEVEQVVSMRHCGGGASAARAYEYDGLRSCASVARLAGSPLVCPAGCIGFGDCVAACPFDALALDERGLPVVDLDKCTGCEKCVVACPRSGAGLVEMVPEGAPVAVRCSSHDKAREKRGYCSMSCIACKKCERECPEDAIHVVDFCAVVDWEKCTGCGTCVSVCPQQCIDLFGRGAPVSARESDGRGPDVDVSFPLGPDEKEPETASSGPRE